ncbi:hypothetical protein BDV24DRAFT_156236 [Aspergillus arachidicola]|uniref:Uncharacterized protein n=1 Tax=Aspergillus arachidicola TaxID=656916 RepID=A0A5N6XQI6_9EURO|nr:hypothetical protein BDV24DRAFT_156236 [Aspergillus arachidicola]
MNVDLWFSRWKSKDGQKLSNTQISRLVALTRQWRHDDTTDNLSVWASDPATEFWGFKPFCAKGPWIRECLEINIATFKDCDENIKECEKVSARRRVLLIILHEIIQTEILRLTASFQAQSKFLTTAARNVVEQAYPGNSSQHLCNKCTQLQPYGQKYSLLERKELILSPLRCSSANIEGATMKPIEMDALVAFAEATFNKEYQK